MQRPLWKRWAIAVGVFVIFSLGFVFWRGKTQHVEVTLPDGRGVSLLQATVGTRHELEQGSVLARVVAKVGGATRAQRFGYRSIVHSTPAPALIVWTLWPTPPTNPPPRYASLQDNDGMETELIYPLMDASASVSGDRIMVWRFDSYPRRAKSFQIRFHDRPPPYHIQPLGALRVRNPSPTNAPPAGGHEAPIVSDTDGDFVLRRFDVGGDIPLFRRATHSGLAPWTDATFEVRENNVSSTNWIIRELQLRSPSGNVVRVNPLFVRVSTNGVIETGFTSAWWRDEPDWILTAAFGRIGDYGDTNLWIVPALPANGMNTALTTNVVSPFLAPPGAAVSLQPASLDSVGHPGFTRTTDLNLKYRPDNRNRRLELVRVTDDSGRELAFGQQSDNGYGHFNAGLELAPGSRFIQLTFGISTARSVEFRVKPRFVGTNSTRINQR